MAQPNDTIQLSIPTSVPAERRSRIIRQHSQLLSILNNPNSSEAAKKAARQGMHSLREVVAKLGGRVDINMPSEQTDPTTGEITTRRVKESVGPTAHKLQFDIGKPPDVQSPRAITAAITPPPAGLATPTSAPSPITIPPEPTPLRPLGQAAQPATAAKPTVPGEIEDLFADPFLAGVPDVQAEAGAEVGAAESPEMALLRKMINEPIPTAPTGELTTGQKIAYSFLAGLLGIDKVMPLVQGQKAEVVQRFLMKRQERDALMKNLINFIDLQQQTQARADVQADKMQARADLLQSRAVAIQGLHEQSVAALKTAQTAIEALSVDPAAGSQVRAKDLADQGQRVLDQAQTLNSLFQSNPNALVGSDAPITALAQGVADYRKSIDNAIAEIESRAKAAALPDSIQRDITNIQALIPAMDSALRQIEEGIGGPVETRLVRGAQFVATLTGAAWLGLSPDERSEKIGRLEGTLSAVEQLVRTIGPGANISSVEREVFAGILLRVTDNPFNLTGKLQALRAWHDVKLKVLTGQAQQTDADLILLRMEDGIAGE